MRSRPDTFIHRTLRPDPRRDLMLKDVLSVFTRYRHYERHIACEAGQTAAFKSRVVSVSFRRAGALTRSASRPSFRIEAFRARVRTPHYAVRA
ncbi:hypothetical protein EVAR_22700_1 [Eumeta japonica]|uniref:Uncharacterized protein n=1 Tax=Eumeta variegata TaxID=151549 RepID=A0A4C1USN7_EUMVA|nr:hypothetical protein EVAR_22700_1 [Eumeta japonica]